MGISAKAKSKGRLWSPLVLSEPNIRIRKEAGETFAPAAELQRLARSVGQAGAARLLGVGLPHVSKILSNKERVSPELLRRIVSVNYVVAIALQWFYPDEIAGWLTNPEPLLGGRNPLGVLVAEGPQVVVEAIEARMAGAYA